MSRKLTVVGKIRTPMTTQDVTHINEALETMISVAQQAEANTKSEFAKDTINDIVDVLIDCKIDLQDWGKENATLMHDDGFCDPVNTGAKIDD